jgi:hypothetical protein
MKAESYSAQCARLIKNSKFKKGDVVKILNNNCGQPKDWVGKIGIVMSVSTVDIHSILVTYEVKVFSRPYPHQEFHYFERDLELRDDLEGSIFHPGCQSLD